MSALFAALLVASVILLVTSAVSNAAPEWDWAWYAGVGSLTLAVLVAVASGWPA